jgi:hypothetical protein
MSVTDGTHLAAEIANAFSHADEYERLGCCQAPLSDAHRCRVSARLRLGTRVQPDGHSGRLGKFACSNLARIWRFSGNPRSSRICRICSQALTAAGATTKPRKGPPPASSPSAPSPAGNRVAGSRPPAGCPRALDGLSRTPPKPSWSQDFDHLARPTSQRVKKRDSPGLLLRSRFVTILTFCPLRCHTRKATEML